MSIQTKALTLALEALKNSQDYKQGRASVVEAVEDIEEALAQPKQEPVGKFAKFTDGIWREVTDGSAGISLYTTPPKRTWVGLTDDDLVACSEAQKATVIYFLAKLKKKNT